MTNETISMHYEASVMREKMLLHTFLSDVYKWFWRRGDSSLEILHAEVDSAGYDVLLIKGKMKRYIQLKSMLKGSKPKIFPVHTRLAEKNSLDHNDMGCVVLMRFSDSVDEVEYCLYTLPSVEDFSCLKDALNPRTKLPRKNSKGLSSSKVFRDYMGIDKLLENLFKIESN